MLFIEIENLLLNAVLPYSIKMALRGLNEGSINPDLANERLKTTFNVKELTTLLDGSEENTTEKHRIEKLLVADPNIPNPLQLLGLSSDECYKTAVRSANHVDSLIREHLSGTNSLLSLYFRPIYAPSGSPKEGNYALYSPTISRHGTEEQITEFINEKIVGTYAQTELGHGSDIKQLETTATYDANTEEFVLNSPTLTSIKCWAGGLGRTATHAIVMAQLYTKNECHGIHMFVVQLRDVDDLSPLPGRTVGEIGPKMSFLGLDNGYLQLNNVRIPRRNMLMKYAKVLQNGTYEKPEFDRVGYGMMIFMRTIIVKMSAWDLAEACTIAVRYNAIRRQGKIDKNGEDVKILDYKTQQYKLLPQVALSYAFTFVFNDLFSMYMTLDADNVNEFHALVAGMKALSTALCAEASEICRQSCGGLGYLLASRLPTLCAGLIASNTFEGDNTILNLQTARYLIKCARLTRDGKPVGNTIGYLQGSREISQNCMTEFVEMFESTTAGLINYVYKKLNNEIIGGKNEEFAWQDNTIELVKCAKYHSKVFVIRTLHQFFLNTQLSASLRAVLEKLFQLLAVYWTIENSGDFIEFGKVSVLKIEELRTLLPELLKNLRVDIVSLVDAFDFSDAVLQSVIGSFDGRVYERLYEYWSKLPSNQQQKQLLVVNKAKL